MAATYHSSNHPRGNSDEQTQAKYHQLTSQEKWQIVAFIYIEYNPVLQKYAMPSAEIFKKVVNQLGRSVRTVRRVQQKYHDQVKPA